MESEPQPRPSRSPAASPSASMYNRTERVNPSLDDGIHHTRHADGDRELVNRAQRGERGAFDLLIGKYHHQILGLIRRYIHDPVEPMDVAQEVYLNAYRAINGFRGDSSFYTWLYRIAINAAKHHLRSTALSVPLEYAHGTQIEAREGWVRGEVDVLADFDTPEEELQLEDFIRVLYEAIEDLSQDLRQAISLREVYHKSYEEISHVMGCPVGTVRSRIFRARRTVENRLRYALDVTGWHGGRHGGHPLAKACGREGGSEFS